MILREIILHKLRPAETKLSVYQDYFEPCNDYKSQGYRDICATCQYTAYEHERALAQKANREREREYQDKKKQMLDTLDITIAPIWGSTPLCDNSLDRLLYTRPGRFISVNGPITT
jgi:hypothetical protein